jgi:hypothetical protein
MILCLFALDAFCNAQDVYPLFVYIKAVHKLRLILLLLLKNAYPKPDYLSYIIYRSQNTIIIEHSKF